MTVKIFLFADALGFELIRRFRFMERELPCRYPVRTQFGYSSTAVPTILSGAPPTRHGHFSFFYRAAGRSPFAFFRYWHWLLHPSAVFDNHRVRHRLSRLIARHYGYTGYFNLYRVPYARLPYFDYCEKQDIFAPGGLAPVPNLYDMLAAAGVNFHISNWRRSDEENLNEGIELLKRREKEFLFLYTAGLDGMLHFHIGDDATVAARFDAFADRVRELLATARANYDRVDFYLFSDHGMTPLAGSVDLKNRLEGAPYRFGRDFLVCYDSTMVRLWVLNPEAGPALQSRLDGAPGHWLSAAEKAAWNIDFADRRYGDEIFLLDPGIQLAPSDMGAKAIPGMHGYAPEDAHSTAALLATAEPPLAPECIADYFRLMELEAAALRKGGA